MLTCDGFVCPKILNDLILTPNIYFLFLVISPPLAIIGSEFYIFIFSITLVLVLQRKTIINFY